MLASNSSVDLINDLVLNWGNCALPVYLKCLLVGMPAVSRIIFSAVKAFWARSSPTKIESCLREPWEIGFSVNSLSGEPRIAMPVFCFCFLRMPAACF